MRVASVCAAHNASASAWQSGRSASAREASSCGMGAMALPARAGRQHTCTVKGSHKMNDLNAVASKCINLEFLCVNGRPANDQ